jgi:YVTN family beta-propeller protein
MRLIIAASRFFIPLLCVCASLLACPPAMAAEQDFAASSDKVGPNGSGGFETPVNQLLTPSGRQVDLPGMRPVALALSPDKELLVTAGQTHELVTLDPLSGKILQHVPLPGAIADRTPGAVSDAMINPDLNAQISYTGLVFSPNGSRLYMANVNGDIQIFSVRPDHKIRPLFSFPLPLGGGPLRKAEIPAGIAVSADGKRLYVVFNFSNRLAELDAGTGQVLRLWDVGVEPFDVVITQSRAYVSNWGGRRPDANSITGPAGQLTSVRVDPIRHIPSEGSLSIIDLNRGAPPVEILTGLHASGLALSPDGRYVVVANAGSDTLSVINTHTDEIVETICARQNPGDLFGAQPNAMAFDKLGDTLFVCNGTQNAVAVIHFAPGKSKLLGLVPVGWFPGAIVYDAKQKAIAVANIKGATENPTKRDGRTAFNSMHWHGSVSLVPIPDARELEGLTRTALADMRYPLLAAAILPARPGQAPRPVPERAGEPSLIKHVIYILKENRTYDQVLGDVTEGNGDSALCIFNKDITPNEHKLVHDFVLLDNTYCCGSRSPDGHQWTDSALANDYMEKIYAGFPRSYPFGGELGGNDAMAWSPAGFIWDDALAHGKTLRDYGEFTLSHRQWKDPARKGLPGFLDIYRELTAGTKTISLSSTPSIETLRGYIATDTIGWDLIVPDAFRAAQFIKELKQFEQTGEFPNLVILWLPNDHTNGAKPDSPTPDAMAADNDLAMGKVFEAVSHSSFWKDTCIFAIEDDPQSGWDHVSGYRTTAYLASPYAKRGKVISTQYNQTSILRTIELMLGLPPMNQMDATATPMFDCFADAPDFAPFDAVPNNVPLDQMNPEPKKISDRQLRKDAYVSARLPLEKPDQCPDDVLNHILWRATKGTRTPYPVWAVKPDDDD